MKAVPTRIDDLLDYRDALDARTQTQRGELERGEFLIRAHRIAMDFGLPAALRAIEIYERGHAGAGRPDDTAAGEPVLKVAG